MSNIENVLSIDCQKINQYNVDFYIGKIKADDLCSIASVTHRIITEWDENNQPIYNEHVQRQPNKTRVNSIKDFLLNDEIACFPNNILLSVPSILLKEEISEDNPILKIDLEKVNLSSEDKPLYIQIIDGQHRFRGIQVAMEELEKKADDQNLQKLKDFEFVISFFIDPGIDFQAMLFSIINRTPVKASQDLVYDLFGLLKKPSPQKTALAITLELNGLAKTDSGKDGPFYKRIRLLGKKEKGENSPISQGMFVKTIIKLICPTLRVAEIERFKSREYFHEGGNERTILRDYYANNKDNLIFRVLLNYFLAVQETFLDAKGNSFWVFGKSVDNPLQRTIGFLALMDILIDLFPIGLKEKRLTTDFFKEHLTKASDLELVDENSETKFVYSSKGKSELKDALYEKIFG